MVYVVALMTLCLLLVISRHLKSHVAVGDQLSSDYHYRNQTFNESSGRHVQTKSSVSTSPTVQTVITTLTKKPVDMVNDYYPFVDFKFTFPEVMPTLKLPQEFFLVVLVNSAAKGDVYRTQRDVIRKTWGSHDTCDQKKIMENPKLRNLKWMLVFVLGKVVSEEDNKRNKNEAIEHNDMLIGDIDDNYINNIIKLYMGQLWAKTFFPNAKYSLKTDDDVFVRIPRLIEYLANANFPRQFYGGARFGPIRVNRRLTGKWSISWKYFPERNFPAFNLGAFIVLSTDLLNYLFNYVQTRKPFHTDDAYIGIAMRDGKINITWIRSFTCNRFAPRTIPQRSDCQILKLIGFGHRMKPKLQEVLHNRIERLMCKRNVTTESCKG